MFGMRAAPGAIERVRIDAQTKVARFRVIGEERWSDEWQIGPDATPETQPRYLAAGICGSGIIEVVAEMFVTGILQPDGRFNPNHDHARVQWQDQIGAYVLTTAEESASGEPILVTQQDVRNIQLAKAALYAGCKLLMDRASIQQVDRIVMAGAFGSYIDPKYAMILGLIPDCELEKVTAVGNAAGDGARIALLNQEKRLKAQEVAYLARYIETALDPKFQEEFVNAIHLPHAQDVFPHLDGLLPVVERAASAKRPRRRRRRQSLGTTPSRQR